jgi:hypothetical protein
MTVAQKAETLRQAANELWAKLARETGGRCLGADNDRMCLAIELSEEATFWEDGCRAGFGSDEAR